MFTFRNIRNVSSKNFVLSFFVIILFALFAMPNLKAQDSADAITVNLPTAVNGVAKIEYLINGKSVGSTTGSTSSELKLGDTIRFLIKFEESAKNTYLKNVFINDENESTGLECVTGIKEDGTFFTRSPQENEKISPSTSYISKQYTILSNTTFRIPPFLKLNLTLDFSNTGLTENLKDIMGIECSANGVATSVKTDENESAKKYVVEGIEPKSNITLTLKPTNAFAQLKGLKITNSGDVDIGSGITGAEGSTERTLTLESLNSDETLTITGLVKNTYSISGENISETVTHGTSYTYTGTVESEKCLTANGIYVDPSVEPSKYTFDNITEDIELKIVEISAAKYKITAPTADSHVKIQLSAENKPSDEPYHTVKHNNSFSFKVVPEFGYNLDKGITVKANDTTLTANEGFYSIENITSNISISVTGAQPNIYNVKFPTDATTFTCEIVKVADMTTDGLYKVNHGNNIKVNVIPTDASKCVTTDNFAFTKMNDNEALTSVSVALTAEDRANNSYTFEISNITEHTKVNISNLGARTLMADFKSDLEGESDVFNCINDEMEIYQENKAYATHGSNIKFKVVPTSGYEIGANGLNVTVGGSTTLSPPDENGYYTLENITSDITVTVSGIMHKNVPVHVKIEHPDLKITNVNGTSIADSLTQYSAEVPYNTSGFSITVACSGEETITVNEIQVSSYPTLNTSPTISSSNNSLQITFTDAITQTTAITIRQISNTSQYTAWRLTNKYTLTATDLDKNGKQENSSNSNNHIPHIQFNSTGMKKSHGHFCSSEEYATDQYTKEIKYITSGDTQPSNNSAVKSTITCTHKDDNSSYNVTDDNIYDIGTANIDDSSYWFIACPLTFPGRKLDGNSAEDYNAWEFGSFRVTLGSNNATFNGPGRYALPESSFRDSTIEITENPARYQADAATNGDDQNTNHNHYYTEVKLSVTLGPIDQYTIKNATSNGTVKDLFDNVKIEMLFKEKPQTCDCDIDFEIPTEIQEDIKFVSLNENNGSYSINNSDLLTTNLSKGSSLYFAVFYNDICKLESSGVSISPSDNFLNLDIKKINCEHVSDGKLENNLPDGFTGYYIYKISEPRVEQAKVYISKFEKTSYEVKLLGTGSTYQNSDKEDIIKANVEHGKDFSFTIKANTGFLNDADTYIIISTNNAYAIFNYDETKEQTSEELNKRLSNITIKCKDKKFEINIKEVKNNFSVFTFRNRDTREVMFNLPEGLKYEVVSNEYTTDGEEQPENGNNSEFGNGIENVPYQNNFEFRIVATDPKYDLSNISVTSNYSPIPLINDKYTLKEVTEDTTIRVENLQIIKNKVTLTQYDYVTYKNENGILLGTENEVDYGASLAFKVILSEYYSNSKITVKFEDENNNKGEVELPVINADNDQSADTEIVSHSETGENSPYFSIKDRIITINNVTSNTRIFISNLKPNKYQIKLVHHEGIKYYDKTQQNELKDSEDLKVSTEQNSTIMEVTYGENFDFSIMSDDGYDISNLKVYYIGDNKDKIQKVLAAVDNVYTLEDVSENYTVVIEDVKKSVHQLEFRTVTGVNALDLFGKKLTSTQNITDGDTYTFKISLESAYNRSNPKVMIKGGNEIIPSSNGEYTTPQIKENIIIEILNVEKNSYTVTFKDAEGVIYQNAKNKPFTGQQTIEYDGVFEFKISLMDAYDSSTPLVTINGNNDDIIESSSSSKFEYILQGVESDIEIVVKNVVRNPEEITIEQVNDVPDKIVTYDDVEAVVKATKIYMNLSDEEREKVTNIADLQRAQKESAELTHSSGGMTAQNLDWNIRLMVTHLSDDKDKMKAFEKNIERRKLLTLYDIKLVDVLTDKDYDVPEDEEITIELDAPNLDGYMNAVMAHQITNGNMEYLDLNVVENTAYFKTSSFSLFGIAAKQIPNYLKNSSDLKISVKDLVENEEELKSLLGEGLVSQLGDILDEDNGTQSNPIDSFLKGNLNINELAEQTNLTKIYSWALENEFLAVILILLIGTFLIWLILKLSKKKT